MGYRCGRGMKPEPSPPTLPLLLPQVLHFFVGFGALLSPLIADPFLSENSCLPANSTVNVTSGSRLFHASRVLGQHHTGAWPWVNQTLPGLPPPDGAGTRVSYAFWIMALINVSATGMAGGGGRGEGGQSQLRVPSIPAPAEDVSDSEKRVEAESALGKASRWES